MCPAAHVAEVLVLRIAESKHRVPQAAKWPLLVALLVIRPFIKLDGIVGRLAFAVRRHQKDDRRGLALEVLAAHLLEVDRLGIPAALARLTHQLVAESLGRAGLRAP